MDIQYIFGVSAVVLAVITGTYIHLRQYELKTKYRFEARTSAEYKRKSKEADEWRRAYEEAKAHAEELESIIKIQNMVYGKIKLNEVTNYADSEKGKTEKE